MGLLQEICELIVGGISNVGGGIATGVAATATALLCNVDATTKAITGLSTFGTIVVVFAGVSLAFGLSRWVMNFVTSLGAKSH